MKFRVIHLTSSLKIGGAEALLYDLLRTMDGDLFENSVIYFHYGPNVEKIENLGIKTYQIKGLICRYDPIFFIRLFWLIFKLKPHCIHSLLWAANFSGTLIAKILRIPIVCALHLSSNFESRSKSNFLRSQIDKFVFKNTDEIIAVSQTVFDQVKKNYKISNDKIKVIKNGIDINYIEKICSTEKLDSIFNRKDDYFVIGCVGRFIPRKNHSLLIDSFYELSKKYQNLHLILVGNGELENSLKSRCFQLKIENKVTFSFSNSAYKFYKLFDCFVLCSQEEGLSIALLEAMSFSLPCIVTSDDKCHEVVEDNLNGLIIGKNNKLDLINAIEKVYLERELAKKFGINAKNTVLKNFNLKIMTDQYSNVFKNISNKEF